MLIAYYVSLLDIDRKNDLVELDIENLILKIASANSNRSDYLWDVGSGTNWMGYHLSTMFALHEHFLSLPHNFVPSFILIDQPSQVYFPRDILHAPEEIKTYEELSTTIEDFNQTRKIFESAPDFITRTKGEFQISTVEHAPELTREGIPNIHLSGEWRKDKALVLIEWLK